jgi:hypothetical protein
MARGVSTRVLVTRVLMFVLVQPEWAITGAAGRSTANRSAANRSAANRSRAGIVPLARVSSAMPGVPRTRKARAAFSLMCRLFVHRMRWRRLDQTARVRLFMPVAWARLFVAP